MNNQRLVSWLLKSGIAFVLFYAAAGSFLDPLSWVGFFPQWMRDLVDQDLLLMFFSVYEIALGVWILWGRWARYSALLAAATFAGIIVANLGAFDLVFRDVTMVFAALALAALHWRQD